MLPRRLKIGIRVHDSGLQKNSGYNPKAFCNNNHANATTLDDRLHRDIAKHAQPAPHAVNDEDGLTDDASNASTTRSSRFLRRADLHCETARQCCHDNRAQTCTSPRVGRRLLMRIKMRLSAMPFEALGLRTQHSAGNYTNPHCAAKTALHRKPPPPRH